MVFACFRSVNIPPMLIKCNAVSVLNFWEGFYLDFKFYFYEKYNTSNMEQAAATEKTYNEWLMQKASSDERMMYSVKRMDLLIISISGAVIFIVFQMLKFMHTKDYQGAFNYLYLLKIAGGFGVFSILSNFLSQIYGLKTNRIAYNLANHKCWLLKHDKSNDDEFYKTKCDRDSKRKFVIAFNLFGFNSPLLAA